MNEQKFVRCSAHLPVSNLRQSLDYYRDQLGFYDEWMFGEKDGGIRRNEMRLLFAEDPEYTSRINNGEKRLPLLWFVNDIDAIYQEFQQRNIPIASHLQHHPYGLREFAFIDINGYYIRIAEGDD